MTTFTNLTIFSDTVASTVPSTTDLAWARIQLMRKLIRSHDSDYVLRYVLVGLLSSSLLYATMRKVNPFYECVIR